MVRLLLQRWLRLLHVAAAPADFAHPALILKSMMLALALWFRFASLSKVAPTQVASRSISYTCLASTAAAIAAATASSKTHETVQHLASNPE